MAMNRIIGSSPSAEAIGGTIGNRAGVTTPSVLENSDMNAATTPKTSGTRIGGMLLPIHDARMSMVPALMATEMSMPTPQIMISVAQGTEAMALRSSPSFSSSAMTENKLAIRPMSIFELMKPTVALSGRAMLAIGAASTMAIIASVSHS